MRNLQKLIHENHGIETLGLLQLWEKCAIKDSDFKNYWIFTLRCICKGVIPDSVLLGSTRKDITKKAREIIKKAEKQLLQERVRYINVILENNGKKLENSRSRLLSFVTTMTTQGKCIEFINKVREDRFNKVKQRQVSTFNRLITKTNNKINNSQDRETSASGNNNDNLNHNQLQTGTSQSNQGSTRNKSNKCVINLSKTPLTPAQESLLAKGPNFAIIPKVPPNVDYISAIESISQNLTEQDAQELKADINSLPKRFPAPHGQPY